MRAPVIFLDLDGTIIGPPGDVHPVAWKALDAAREQGRALCVCTGRPSGGLASRIARRLGPSLPHIFHGGAVILDGDDGVSRAEAMPRSALEAMVERARREALTLELYTADCIWVDAVTPVHARHLSLLDLDGRVGDLLALIEEAEIVKAQWIVYDAALAHDLAECVPDDCFAARGDSQAMSKARFVTITRQGIDKGAAVRHVAGILGADPRDCAAVGDSTGDVPMLDAVGRPFVTADAPAALQARYPVVPSVREHGILQVLSNV